jgi:hypothetical protein
MKLYAQDCMIMQPVRGRTIATFGRFLLLSCGGAPRRMASLRNSRTAGDRLSTCRRRASSLAINHFMAGMKLITAKHESGISSCFTIPHNRL